MQWKDIGRNGKSPPCPQKIDIMWLLPFPQRLRETAKEKENQQAPASSIWRIQEHGGEKLCHQLFSCREQHGCMLISKGGNNIIPSLSCKQFHETIQNLLSKVMMIGYFRILDVKVKAQSYLTIQQVQN